MLDLLIRELFGGAEQAVAGIAHDDVDAAELAEGAVDHLMHRRRVGDVEHLRAECLGVALGEVGDLAGVADGAHDAVAALQELSGELAAEAAADAGDEPGAL